MIQSVRICDRCVINFPRLNDQPPTSASPNDSLSRGSAGSMRSVNRLDIMPGTVLSTWQLAVWIIVLCTALRLVYAIWLSPWDLIGDEAYYWLQAKHFDLGYDEKGPLLAWLIAGCCRLFGDVEWAVRLPVILAWGASAWGCGRLAMSVAKGDQRVGAVASVLFLLTPAFAANAQICTQDGLLITLWLAMTALCMRLFRRWREGLSLWREWMGFYALMGIGMLLKQSIPLFLPGMALYWLWDRKQLPLRPVIFLQQLVGLIVVAAMCTPMLIWNARHGWPMIAHTLGHLGAGGDQAGKVIKGNFLQWQGATLGGLIAAFGPALVLMIISSIHVLRTSRRAPSPVASDHAWLVCSGWFSTLFFIALGFMKPVVPSWPFPSMAPLVVVVATFLVPATINIAPLPPLGIRRLWRAAIVYGVLGVLGLAFPTAVLKLPFAERVSKKRMLGGFGTAREHAMRLHAVVSEITASEGKIPAILAPNYGMACLTCFYLPGHPAVSTRDSHLTNRPSTLDEWPETNLDDPMHQGRTMVLMLDRRNDPRWEETLFVDSVKPSTDPDYLIATNFRGFRISARPAKTPGGKP